jgi:hypothetical protein
MISTALVNHKKRLSFLGAIVLITALVFPFAAPTEVAAAETSNTAGTVASSPVATGGASEYAFSLRITSSTVSGITAGQVVWCAAKITDFPNLLTAGAALSGNLDNSLGWWVLKAPTTPVEPPATGCSAAGTVASTPVATGGANEYAFSLRITSSTVSGITAGQVVWCAAKTTDFPNLLTPGAALSGNLDNSFGWWRLLACTTTPPVEPPPSGSNTAGTVASMPVATGGAGEYAFSLRITSSTVSGIMAGQLVWCAAKITDFPNLLTAGAALSGNLDNSLGWWVFKKASTTTTPTTPAVITMQATYVNSMDGVNYAATVNGDLAGLGNATSASVYFQLGTSTDYSRTSTPTTMNTVGSFMTVFGTGQANDPYLIPNTTYHFRAVAIAGTTTVWGNDMTFLTTPYPNPPGQIVQAVTLQQGHDMYVANLTQGDFVLFHTEYFTQHVNELEITGTDLTLSPW